MGWCYVSGMANPVVVKVGGSLFDLPDLGDRLRAFLALTPRLESARGARIVLVPGGGATADAVRALDRTHNLGEATSHWLALRAMALNARFLAKLVDGDIAYGVKHARRIWGAGRVAVLDAYKFCRADERDPGRLPHSWAVTADSVAARFAVVCGAAELVLLKSAEPPPGDVAAWAAAGYVDAHVPAALGERPMPVRAVCLSAEPHAEV
ncbi:MAG: hypothetical protein U0746_03560 [Gemmataceae bacterium]